MPGFFGLSFVGPRTGAPAVTFLGETGPAANPGRDALIGDHHAFPVAGLSLGRGGDVDGRASGALDTGSFVVQAPLSASQLTVVATPDFVPVSGHFVVTA
jgi:hypothetical protein